MVYYIFIIFFMLDNWPILKSLKIYNVMLENIFFIFMKINKNPFLQNYNSYFFYDWNKILKIIQMVKNLKLLLVFLCSSDEIYKIIYKIRYNFFHM